jgi:hypothetical protein
MFIWIFYNLILKPRDVLTDGCRVRKSKNIRRSITLKSLATDFEVLKREMQDLKKMLVSSQSLPNERYQKKRVSFQDNVIWITYKWRERLQNAFSSYCIQASRGRPIWASISKDQNQGWYIDRPLSIAAALSQPSMQRDQVVGMARLYCFYTIVWYPHCWNANQLLVSCVFSCACLQLLMLPSLWFLQCRGTDTMNVLSSPGWRLSFFWGQ